MQEPTPRFMTISELFNAVQGQNPQSMPQDEASSPPDASDSTVQDRPYNMSQYAPGSPRCITIDVAGFAGYMIEVIRNGNKLFVGNKISIENMPSTVDIQQIDTSDFNMEFDIPETSDISDVFLENGLLTITINNDIIKQPISYTIR